MSPHEGTSCRWPRQTVSAAKAGPGDYFIALIAPQREFYVARKLAEEGQVKAYVPVEKVTRVVRGRARKVLRPLMPGYLLFPASSSGAFRAVLAVPGARGLLRLGERLMAVPAALVWAMRQRESEMMAKADLMLRNKWRKLGQPARLKALSLKLGGKVPIKSGPFAGFIGKIESIDEHKRIGVLLSMFGRQSRVWLESEQVEVA